MLTRLDALPAGFIDVPAAELHRLLPGPTLVRLPGEARAALFVTILQHGNEDTGLDAVQRLLASYGAHPLPRPLWLFIANPEAARHGRRRLDGQRDLNRCWPGTELPEGPETRLLSQVVETVTAEPLLAAIDVHNTTGESPLYAGVNRLEAPCLHLARDFARTVVYFTRPRGAMSQAMLTHCPAVTLECGPVGNPFGGEPTEDYLERCLRLDSLPQQVPADIDLFESVAVVHVPDAVSFHFGTAGGTDLVLDPAIDRLNFRELAAGTELGEVHIEDFPVRAVDPDGADVTERHFELASGRLRLRRAVMPSLLTRDPRAVRLDCLCHLMERRPMPA